MKKTPLLLAAGLLATAVFRCAAQGSLVVRRDFAVPETWAQKKVMGYGFLPCFVKEYWTDDRTKADRPDLGQYDECADMLNGRTDLVLSRLREGSPSTTNYAVENPPETVCGTTYTFEQAMNATRLSRLDQSGREKYPFFVRLPGDRPSFLLDPDYASRQDREAYRAWRAQHPNCLGGHTLGEYDQQAMWYRSFSGTTSDKQVLAELRESFPFPPQGTSEAILQRDWFPKWVKECFRREREYYFGEESIWSLHSGCPSLAHIMVEAGASGFFYECTPQSAGSWTSPAAFSRGASRQFGVPFGWYVANFVTAYARDGSAASGEESRAITPDPSYPAFGLNRGASRSLIRRQMTYGWLVGATLLEPENWYHYHREEYEKGKFRPSVYAADMQELVDRAKTTDRGVPYTPVAILVPIWERFSRGYWNRDTCDPWGLNAILLTLEPVDAEQDGVKAYDLQRRRGDEACFLNSPFGGIYDVVCPDATRNRANIAKTLGAYKAAFVAGDFRGDELPEGVFEDYVRDGGTLFVSADKLANGVVDPEFAGVSFGTGRTASGAPFTQTYSVFQPTGTPAASPVLTDEAGNVLVWARDFGKGRIVTVACDRMLPDDYAKCPHDAYNSRLLEAMSPGFRFELINWLLERVQRETMPVSVEGDVQWGVNKVKVRGEGEVWRWLVWMFNNKGVTKFVGEPEELDAAKTAHVTVRCNQAVKTVEVGPGGIAYVTFEDSSLFCEEPWFREDAATFAGALDGGAGPGVTADGRWSATDDGRAVALDAVASVEDGTIATHGADAALTYEPADDSGEQGATVTLAFTFTNPRFEPPETDADVKAAVSAVRDAADGRDYLHYLDGGTWTPSRYAIDDLTQTVTVSFAVDSLRGTVVYSVLTPEGSVKVGTGRIPFGSRVSAVDIQGESRVKIAVGARESDLRLLAFKDGGEATLVLRGGTDLDGQAIELVGVPTGRTGRDETFSVRITSSEGPVTGTPTFTGLPRNWKATSVGSGVWSVGYNRPGFLLMLSGPPPAEPSARDAAGR